MDLDYIPLVTDEFRIAFCQATEPLCSDVQRIIWKKLLYENIELYSPPTPKKCRIQYSRVSGNFLPPSLLAHLNRKENNIKNMILSLPLTRPERR